VSADPASARQRATDAQRAAADPAVSAFVSASAGSGKTKLLIDRLLRLLLGGAEPSRILCLTYTTAAAAEMALRLRRELGKWATADEPGLDAALRELGLTPSQASRDVARTLFARVLDLPGGMRIETIHAFCQSLLRRFPLEAAVSPHFRLLADADATAALQTARETMLEAAEPIANRELWQPSRSWAIARVAGAVGLSVFFHTARTLADDRDRLRGLLARPLSDLARAQREALGATRDEAAILDDAVAWPEEPELTAAMRVIARDGPPARTAPDARTRLEWLSRDPAGRRAGWAGYAASYLSASSGEPLSLKTLVGDRLGRKQPELGSAVGDEVGRVLRLLDEQCAQQTARLSEALLALALPMAETYAEAKRATARLDYHDLIDGSTGLLSDPGAAWVLHKLDGGLDHLLLDEVQDTSPAQWEIAGALVEEFFAGKGARDITRTVFAVGDRKQSIFSFQGAAPASFDEWRGKLREWATGAGQAWRDITLDVSFRSTAPVLALVDAVFADPIAARGVTEGGLRHLSDRVGQAGAVELWPLEPKSPRTEPPPWDAPTGRLREKGAPQRLAERVADWIDQSIRDRALLPSRERAIRAGDVLVLVRRRDDLARAIVRALKHRGVPVAGLDRMTLTEQPAVADLLALGDALLLPRDDLAVACVLTSPLGGLSDDDLIELAPRRQGFLWDELRRRAAERPGWAAAWGFLSALFARVDYAPPHALFCEALGPLGGRARLLARLGEEAAEPIDELLAAALAHAREHPPSLQGFLHWLRRAAAEVKRQPEAAGGRVRLMTVHGAKGLQAPVVILPDTTGTPPERDTLFWAGDVPIWAPAKDWRSRAVETVRDTARLRADEEHNRLLYVALTRAEDRLIVCGYETHRALPDDCWYRAVERGMTRLSTEAIAAPTGPAARHASAQSARPDRTETAASREDPRRLPAWAGAAPDWTPSSPPDAAAGPARLAPSRPPGADLGPVPPSASPLRRTARFERGQLLHALLQHLPDLPPASRLPAARRHLLARGLTPGEQDAALGELVAVLDAPALADAFGPGSRAEVPLTGLIGDQVVGGLVDRLVVRPERVLLVDYKTNRRPPGRPDRVPVAYLRQMAAYRAVLTKLYPERSVRCVLVWTVGADVMDLPPALLDRFAPGARQTAGEAA
jgi:ATP-dependent helicase/nuclease subunit A